MTVAAPAEYWYPRNGDARHRETVRTVRDILAEQGLSESALKQNRASARVRGRTGEVGLLKCCRALARRGFALTLFLSGRTSVLFVREE